MRIGLTYDLRSDYLAEGYGEEETAEFDRPDTIDAIENALRKLGHETDRVGHLRALVARLARGDRWDFVFNICEGMHGFCREAQVPALLQAYAIPCVFSDPLLLAVGLHKAWTKRLLHDMGVPTPPFALVETENDIAEVNLPYPLFAKPVGEGTSKGVTPHSRIDTPGALQTVCADLLGKYRQPVLVETFLPGREFTVGILGTGPASRAVGVLEVALRENAESHAYTYANKENCEELITYTLASDPPAQRCAELALRVWKALGCRDAGRVDFRLDESGVPNFIEINPLAGLHPEHSDLPMICSKSGIAYDDLIRMILESALERSL